MPKDGAPFRILEGGHYICSYGIYDCGNHVPDIEDIKNEVKKRRQAGVRPCGMSGPCRCFSDKNWKGNGNETCIVLSEMEKKNVRENI